MRILLIGCVEFSSHSFATVLQAGGEVVGVVTRESSPFNTDFVDLKKQADDAKIPSFYATGNNQAEMAAWMRSYSPDIIFCFGWSYLLKSEILSLAPMGVVGYHPALLPANRGRHPLIWALSRGLSETGSSFFFMDEGADSGDLLSQRVLPITKEDTAATLYEKMSGVAQEQIKEFLPKLRSGNYPRIPQDHSKANYWRKRGKKDGLIDWRMSALAIYNHVRSLSQPYPGAHCVIDGTDSLVWRVETIENIPENLEPGKVIEGGNTPVVKCGEGAVRLSSHQLPRELKEGEYL